MSLESERHPDAMPMTDSDTPSSPAERQPDGWVHVDELPPAGTRNYDVTIYTRKAFTEAPSKSYRAVYIGEPPPAQAAPGPVHKPPLPDSDTPSVNCPACGQTKEAKPAAEPEPEAPAPPEDTPHCEECAHPIDSCATLYEGRWLCTPCLAAAEPAPAPPVMAGYAAAPLGEPDSFDEFAPAFPASIVVEETWWSFSELCDRKDFGGLAFLGLDGVWRIYGDGAPVKYAETEWPVLGLHNLWAEGRVVIRPRVVMLAEPEASSQGALDSSGAQQGEG